MHYTLRDTELLILFGMQKLEPGKLSQYGD
jgi:hypothetical protein